MTILPLHLRVVSVRNQQKRHSGAYVGPYGGESRRGKSDREVEQRVIACISRYRNRFSTPSGAVPAMLWLTRWNIVLNVMALVPACLVGLGLPALGGTRAKPDAPHVTAPKLDYLRDIRPILAANCF